MIRVGSLETGIEKCLQCWGEICFAFHDSVALMS